MDPKKQVPKSSTQKDNFDNLTTHYNQIINSLLFSHFVIIKEKNRLDDFRPAPIMVPVYEPDNPDLFRKEEDCLLWIAQNK
jgi:hypothetical protein